MRGVPLRGKEAPACVSDAVLHDRLAAIVGPASVLTLAEDKLPYEREQRGRFPACARFVVRPGDTAAVAATVALCAELNVPIVPQGGNTGLVGASTPDESGLEIVLNLGRMDRVRDIDVLGNTMTVEAGCVLQTLQDYAAERGRLFPLSLAAEGSATIGGNLSTNAGGERVLRYGNARDLALGLEVVLADGRVWHGLSPLRKDNTGYDLKHLFIGSEGTLGVITAATLKLLPAAQSQETAWVRVPDPQAAVELLAHLRQRLGNSVSAFELMRRVVIDLVLHQCEHLRDPLGPSGLWTVLVEVSDEAPDSNLTERFQAALHSAMEQRLVLDAAIAGSEQQTRSFWRIRDFIPEAQRTDGPSVKSDISVPISRLADFISRTDALLEQRFSGLRMFCFGHVGDGNLHYNVGRPLWQSPADFSVDGEAIAHMINETVAALGGSISAEHGIGRQKQAAFLRYKDPVAVELMGRIKQAFDPDGLFNPGRLLPARLRDL